MERTPRYWTSLTRSFRDFQYGRHLFYHPHQPTVLIHQHLVLPRERLIYFYNFLHRLCGGREEHSDRRASGKKYQPESPTKPQGAGPKLLFKGIPWILHPLSNDGVLAYSGGYGTSLYCSLFAIQSHVFDPSVN